MKQMKGNRRIGYVVTAPREVQADRVHSQTARPAGVGMASRAWFRLLACKTLCFSRSFLMYDLLMGVYRNRVEFGCAYEKG